MAGEGKQETLFKKPRIARFLVFQLIARRPSNHGALQSENPVAVLLLFFQHFGAPERVPLQEFFFSL